eukprot:41602-Eustigmatos_ZCMA.PRE.1
MCRKGAHGRLRTDGCACTCALTETRTPRFIACVLLSHQEDGICAPAGVPLSSAEDESEVRLRRLEVGF